MHIAYLRDIPLVLGVLAILAAFARGGKSFSPCVTPDGENPQWYCRAILNFIGIVLIGFAILGNYSPH